MLHQLHRTQHIPTDAQVFLPFAAPPGVERPVTTFRTTWLASSLAALRERDLFGAYLKRLPEAYHADIVGSVAAQWAPIELAVRHYDACDRLELTDLELESIGADVTKRVHGTMLSTLVKLAKQSGVTPWVAFSQFQRLWARIWEGGDVCVYQLGPKDAVIQVVGWPIARNRYVQRSMPAVVRAAIEPFCRRSFATYLRNLSSDSAFTLHASWA